MKPATAGAARGASFLVLAPCTVLVSGYDGWLPPGERRTSHEIRTRLLIPNLGPISGSYHPGDLYDRVTSKDHTGRDHRETRQTLPGGDSLTRSHRRHLHHYRRRRTRWTTPRTRQAGHHHLEQELHADRTRLKGPQAGRWLCS